MYTIKTKVVVAGDFLNALGWLRRLKSVERDREFGVPIPVELKTIFRRGVQRELERVQEDARAGKTPRSKLRALELKELLAWGDALREEGSLDDKDGKEARGWLRDIWEHVYGTQCPSGQPVDRKNPWDVK